MQKLIMITGESCTGKTTCGALLHKRLYNSAYLDGDDVWRVNPFSCSDTRLRNSDHSMAFVIDNYLKSKFDYVIFSSIVLCDKQILERILSLIETKDYELIMITLYAPRKILNKRAKLRDDHNSPEFRLLESSLKQESLLIETTNKTPEVVVDEMECIIRNYD